MGFQNFQYKGKYVIFNILIPIILLLLLLNFAGMLRFIVYLRFEFHLNEWELFFQ